MNGLNTNRRRGIKRDIFKDSAVIHGKRWTDGNDPIQNENQCRHGRDAHAPLAIVCNTLSLHFKGSDFGAGERRWEKSNGRKKTGLRL
jgi:hypothetical protein